MNAITRAILEPLTKPHEVAPPKKKKRKIRSLIHRAIMAATTD